MDISIMSCFIISKGTEKIRGKSVSVFYKVRKNQEFK